MNNAYVRDSLTLETKVWKILSFNIFDSMVLTHPYFLKSRSPRIVPHHKESPIGGWGRGRLSRLPSSSTSSWLLVTPMMASPTTHEMLPELRSGDSASLRLFCDRYNKFLFLAVACSVIFTTRSSLWMS